VVVLAARLERLPARAVERAWVQDRAAVLLVAQAQVLGEAHHCAQVCLRA
jgi:hypothetical protein